jgi:uncharacterized protein YecE (DUF72 family)
MMSEKSTIRIGTSGWHYDHWKGSFYPPEMPSDEFLSYYADHFQTVEINNSFYRLPDADTFAQWRDAVPEGFLFAVKASRYITHMKKLKDPQGPVSHFMEQVRALGDKLGPILFQLPPRWKANPKRLDDFLEALPSGCCYAFEFRDPSWFDERVYTALREHGAAFCIYNLNGRLSPQEVTAGTVYVRLHGPDGAYQGRYGSEQLSNWAEAFSVWSHQGREIYCYFDNDQAGYATMDARELIEIVGA